MTDTITHSLYLTKLIVNPAHPNANRALRDINHMHRTLTALACPPDFGPSSRSAAGLLYRIDHTTTGIHILTQSVTELDTTRIPSGFAHAGTRDIEPLLAHLHAGLLVRYRITLNATKAPRHLQSQAQHRSIITPLAGDQALTWWHRKAEANGLRTHPAATADTTKLRGRKNGNTITITATTIEGTAHIGNPDTLRTAIHTGIGRARAYGCGLLSLALTR